jgi:hypothetical protein
MSLSRDTRQEKKLKAFRRAQFRLKQRFEYIDWEEDVLIPEVEALKSGREILGLDAGAAFDIQMGDGGADVIADEAGDAQNPAIGESDDGASEAPYDYLSADYNTEPPTADS